MSASARAACSSARSSVRVITQFIFGEYFFRRAKYILVRSVEVVRRARSSAPSSVAGRKARSSMELNFGCAGLVGAKRAWVILGAAGGKRMGGLVAGGV